jgi:hypothetical protein
MAHAPTPAATLDETRFQVVARGEREERLAPHRF